MGISLALPWQFLYDQNASYNLSDGDRRTWTLASTQSIKPSYKTELLCYLATKEAKRDVIRHEVRECKIELHQNVLLSCTKQQLQCYIS